MVTFHIVLKVRYFLHGIEAHVPCSMSKEVAGLAGRHSWEILGDDWRVVFCGLGVLT